MLWSYVEKLVELDRLVRANHPQSPRTRRGVSGAQASMGRAGTLSPPQQAQPRTCSSHPKKAIPRSLRFPYGHSRLSSVGSIRLLSGMAAVTQGTKCAAVPRGLALALSLVLLGVASGDLGHAILRAPGHGILPAVCAADAAPARPDPAPQHVVADCPRCSAGRFSRIALAVGSAHSTGPARQTTCAVFLPETPAPSTARHRVDTARAPPARLIA